MKNKKREEIAAVAWDEGFIVGIGVGMLEAVGILTEQQEKYGNLAGIEDLKKLIIDDIHNARKRYED